MLRLLLMYIAAADAAVAVAVYRYADSASVVNLNVLYTFAAVSVYLQVLL